MVRSIPIILIASVISRVFSLLQAIVLGMILQAPDYGTFAAASGFAMLTGVFRGGGMWMLLGGIEPERFRSDAPPIFWAGMTVGALGAALTAAAAFPVQARYDHAGVVGVMLLLALQLLITPLCQYAQMALTSGPEQGRLPSILLASSILRILAAVGIALGGGGALALILPPMLGTVFESAVCVRMVGFGRRDFTTTRTKWLEALWSMKPVLPLVALSSIGTQGDYFVGSLTLTVASLGLYGFAYQVANQPYLLLTLVLQRVLVQVAARVRADASKAGEHVANTAATAFFLVPAICTGIACLFPMIETIVWGGKWSQAVPLVAILSVGLSGPVAVGVLVTPWIAERRFKAVLATEVLRACSVLAGGAIGVTWLAGMDVGLGRPLAAVEGLAIGVSLFTTVSALVVVSWFVRSSGASVSRLTQALFVGPLTCFLSGYGAWSVGVSLERSFEVFEGRWGAIGVLAVALGIYTLMLVAAMQFVQPLRTASKLLAEPGLRWFEQLARRLGFEVGD